MTGQEEALHLIGDYTLAQTLEFLLACFFITGLFVGAYKIATNVHDKRQLDDSRIATMERNIYELTEQSNVTLNFNNNLTQVLVMQTRYSLVRACTEYLEAGEISPSQLRSVSELYDVYHTVLQSNSYVTALVDKVKELDVVPRAFEHE